MLARHDREEAALEATTDTPSRRDPAAKDRQSSEPSASPSALRFETVNHLIQLFTPLVPSVFSLGTYELLTSIKALSLLQSHCCYRCLTFGSFQSFYAFVGI